MTSTRFGGTKSLIFHPPPAVDQATPSEPVPNGRGKSLPTSRPKDTDNMILAYGAMLRDNATIHEKLQNLAAEPEAFHGNVQVILSLLRQMEAVAIKMLDHSEGK